MNPKNYIVKFKSTKFANRTIKASNLGEAIHKARLMVDRNAIPNKFLILPTNN